MSFEGKVAMPEQFFQQAARSGETPKIEAGEDFQGEGKLERAMLGGGGRLVI